MPSGVVRSVVTAPVTCSALLADGTDAQAVVIGGGCWPLGATAGMPESTTTPTRFLPVAAGVDAHNWSKVSPERGGWLMPLMLPTP